MIEITMNNRKIRAQKNQTILEVARKNNIQIPHLCFHPALKPSGSCKLCGVEVMSPSGKQVIMLSCVLKVKKGMVIHTDSEGVAAHRQKAFNQLLQLAPDSDRIRELAKEFNVIVTPAPNGCIRCRLCIRVCKEIVKANALKMVKTDTGGRIMPEQGRCIGCGTCANLCPTKIITIEDKNNIRTVAIKNQTIGQLPLERCESCSRMYATVRFLNHVEHSTGHHPDTKSHHHLCPTCVKLMSSRTETERERIKK